MTSQGGLVLRAGEVLEHVVDVGLPGGATLQVTVLEADGTPCAGAEVIVDSGVAADASLLALRKLASGPLVGFAETDASGYVELDGQQPGVLTLSVHRAGSSFPAQHERLVLRPS